MPITSRNYSADNFFLNLDNLPCGFIKSMEGGGISGEVVQEKKEDHFVRKHLAGVKYEPISVQIDLSLGKPIYDWVSETWNGKYARKDVDILVADQDMQVWRQREFFNALISETTIPTMDAFSKESCYMTLKLTPEYSRTKPSSSQLPGKVSKESQRRWLPSNFRLEIDGLDCTKVQKVAAFTVKHTFEMANVGDARDYLHEPSQIDFPNLKISLPENAAQSWIDWHTDFVIKGNNDESQEKNGSLTFLSPNLKELARINFFNLGIFRLAPEETQPKGNQVHSITAEMYCERMEFVF